MIKLARGVLGEEELLKVRDAFEYGYFGLAAMVEEFERELARFLGAPHVVATNTGTSALHLALEAAGVGPGDEVVVPSLTFVASFQAVLAAGAVPVACDVDPETLLMDLEDARRRMTPRTKALMPVHYAGQPCDMDALLELGRRSGARIVEDAAHAFGSTSRGRPIGGFGDVTCFSFDSLKTITCGEGGAVVCRDAALAERMRVLRLLGIERRDMTPTGATSRWVFDVRRRGFRYHLSNINAAIGLAQLKKAPAFIARRRELGRRYQEAFRGLAGARVLPFDFEAVAPHLYVLRVTQGRRDALKDFLTGRGIETGLHYIPNHLHSLFKKEGLALPVTERVYRELLTLPLHCGLSDADVGTVIEAVTDFFSKEARHG